MGHINWPELLAGFMLGLTPLGCQQVYRYIRYQRLPGAKKFQGSFWVYHRSTKGTGQIIESLTDARYSVVAGRQCVYNRHVDGDKYGITYKGTISKREGMVRYAELDQSASHERLTWYIIDPFYDHLDKTIGLYLSLDLRGLPVAGPILISRSRVTLSDADVLLEKNILRSDPLFD